MSLYHDNPHHVDAETERLMDQAAKSEARLDSWDWIGWVALLLFSIVLVLFASA